MRRPTIDRWSTDRAVSPVIGVILMVAITVILAAVIGAFVLEIGDQQETAPNTSFDTEEAVTFYKGGGSSHNLTDVKITHAGGDTLDIGQTEIKIEGNETVYGPTSRPPTSISGGSLDGWTKVAPQPNTCRTAGTNEKVSFSSGESWIPAWHAEPTGEGISTKDWTGGGAKWKAIDCTQTPYGSKFETQSDGLQISIRGQSGYDVTDADGGDVLRAGEEVTVVWSASSGGKTQTLQRYTVQTTSPELS